MDVKIYQMRLRNFCRILMLTQASLPRDMLTSGRVKDQIMIKLNKFFKNGTRRRQNGKSRLSKTAIKISTLLIKMELLLKTGKDFQFLPLKYTLLILG